MTQTQLDTLADLLKVMHSSTAWPRVATYARGVR